MVSAISLQAQDAPHSELPYPSCAACHINHPLFGNQIYSRAGNANACLACHQFGGSASREALAEGQQAALGAVAPAQPPGRGNSHRWDAGPAGRIEALGSAPSDAVAAAGRYTGRYAAAYTVTITSPGNSGVARFDWIKTAPGAGRGTNLVTGTNVPLELGLNLSFRNVTAEPTFHSGDQWRFTVHPDLQMPTNQALLRMMPDGKVVCATCHDVHFQELEPFDRSAPAYSAGGGAGRHFMRSANDRDQLCAECHASRFVTNALAGSHPVGVTISSNNVLHPPASLPLGKNDARLWCSTCHQVHDSASDDGFLLRSANESKLCAECHANVDVNSPASHLNPKTGPLWPGGQYGSQLPADANANHRGACGSCHRAHGWPDAANATNDYPSLLVEREENLCYTCHDGSPASKNLVTTFAKTYRHPVSYSGRHTTTEDGIPARYGTANRHSECQDCHNPHQLTADYVAPIPPAASMALRGVARVSVTNNSASSVSYTFRSPTNTAPVKEYEVCFTCHSGWTTRPSGQADYAAKFNTKIASFHPVEGVGKNTNINVNAFVNNWKADQVMTCTDCHTSDDTTIRGPHGSAYQFILKKVSPASTTRRSTAMPSTELCFDCHRFDTYANSSASSTIKNYSRFAGGNGHGYHVGSRRYSCYNCHETHGATTQPNLLVTGRSPGITTYSRTTNGGSCVATCHGSESYTVAYPR